MDIKDFITETAKDAGELIKSHFGQVKRQRNKLGRGDIVTEVDEESEELIIGRIKKAFPEHSILSEEAGFLENKSNDYIWMIDPLDGTRNYTLGIPFFCVSIALTQNGITQHGAVYDPLHDEMFYAERGKGATMNGLPIHVSTESDMEDAIISISWLRRRTEHTTFIRYVEKISRQTSYFRRFGSAALISAYVAAGRADAYLQGAINSWDIAAGTVLIEEAGGVVTDFDGQPLDLREPFMNIIAANPKLHKTIIELVIADKGE